MRWRTMSAVSAPDEQLRQLRHERRPRQRLVGTRLTRPLQRVALDMSAEGDGSRTSGCPGTQPNGVLGTFSVKVDECQRRPLSKPLRQRLGRTHDRDLHPCTGGHRRNPARKDQVRHQCDRALLSHSVTF